MKPRKPIRKVSLRRQKLNRVYQKVKRQWKALTIRMGIPWTCARCGRPAKDYPHHWAGRRSNLCNVQYFRRTCDPCNLWAKNHPKEAREEGWIAPVGIYRT